MHDRTGQWVQVTTMHAGSALVLSLLTLFVFGCIGVQLFHDKLGYCLTLNQAIDPSSINPGDDLYAYYAGSLDKQTCDQVGVFIAKVQNDVS